MSRYEEDVVMAQEKKLIKELGNMKFSFKKLLKAIELDAYISFYNR